MGQAFSGAQEPIWKEQIFGSLILGYENGTRAKAMEYLAKRMLTTFNHYLPFAKKGNHVRGGSQRNAFQMTQPNWSVTTLQFQTTLPGPFRPQNPCP